MRTTIFLSTLYLVFAFFACNRSDNAYDNSINWTNRIPQLLEYNSKKVNISEGFAGTLILRDGDCMPGTSGNTTCRQYPVTRKIRIYEATGFDKAHGKGDGFYSQIDSRLIASILTDKEGFFQYSIKPGTYSLFIEESGKLYANTSKTGFINAVTVESGKVADGHVQINYATD